PAPGSVPGCGEAGVLGALCGVVGSLQALETIKLITGIGEPLRGRLLAYNALAQHFQTLQFARNPNCPLCGEAPTIHELTSDRYAPAACEPASPTSTMLESEFPLELTATQAKQRRDAAPESTVIIDVREPYEVEI